MTETIRPLLQRYPDARKAAMPLIPPVLLPYIALMLGGLAAAVVSSYNALLLRRPGLVAKSLLVGGASWISFLLLLVAARAAGLENNAVGVILGRLLHFVFGGLLFFLHRPHYRGHEFLNGSTFPLVPAYLVALMISMSVPSRVVLLLLGVPLVR